MGRERVLGGIAATCLVMAVAGAPTARAAQAHPSTGRSAASDPVQYSVPTTTLGSVVGSDAGVAWGIHRLNPDPTSDLTWIVTVHYAAYGGAVGTVDNVWSDYLATPFTLLGSQLTTVSERQGSTGIDITTGARVGQYPATCQRTLHGCFASMVVNTLGQTYQLSYTPDATGRQKTFPLPPLQGTVGPNDWYQVRAVDDRGAVVEAIGHRGTDNCCDTDGVLTYLDFATGSYTVLDDTGYSEEAIARLDDDYLVWTSNRHVYYLDRNDLSAPPGSATPTAGVIGLAINGDKIIYTAYVQPDYDGDYAQPTVTYSGTIGAPDFTQLAATPTGPLTAIDNGDFGVSAGTTSSDYGLYRLTPGATALGERIVSFGVTPYLLPTLAPNDYAGDDKSAQAVVDSDYRWSVAGAADPVQFGARSDIATPTTDSGRVSRIGVFRPSNGTWYQRGATGQLIRTQWGRSGDQPVQAHYAGLDAASVLGVYRPSNHRWYLRGRPSVAYGAAGDRPVPGHYFGSTSHDFADEIAQYRPSTGTWYVQGHPSVQWGAPGDIPAPADYDGDGRTDYAVYRPSTGTWFVKGHPPVRWGAPGDVPVTGDFDGDGTSDVAVYRPSTGTWWVRGVGSLKLGRAGDRVVGRAPFTS